MINIMEKFISSLIQESDKIVIGLSGGPDSVFLTLYLNSLQKEKSLDLHLTHVNYKLRGRDSDLDEQFCREFAERLGLPLEVEVADLSSLKDTPGNIQAEARQRRMRFYVSVAQKYDRNKIALGHTLDDNIETILGNIFRGCGLAGLSGMRTQSGNIIRPLLYTSKKDILEYLDKNGISYRIDASNLESDYTRNKIRNIILPRIVDQVNPGVYDAVKRLSWLATEAHKYFEKFSDNFLDQHGSYSLQNNIIIPLAEFSPLDRILKRHILMKSIERLSGNERDIAAFDLIDSALNIIDSPTGTRADLGGGLMIEKASENLIIFRPVERSEPISVAIPGKRLLQSFNLVLNSEVGSAATEIKHTSDNFKVILDYYKLKGELEVRQFREGDYFRPLGMMKSKKLSEFFIDRKIPRALRMEIPLLVCNGEIAWVIGVEISDLFKLEPASEQAVKLWVEKVVRDVK